MQFTSVLGRWGIEWLGVRVREGEQEGGGEDRGRVLGRLCPPAVAVCVLVPFLPWSSAVFGSRLPFYRALTYLSSPSVAVLVVL